MKPEKQIKILDKAIELVNSMIELRKIPITSKFKEPIPDYSKGSVFNGNSSIVSDNTYKETIITPDGKEALLKGKPIIFKSDFEKGIICSQKDWSKQLNQFLKEKGLNDSQPFGFAPIEDKELNDFKLPVNYKFAIIRFGLGNIKNEDKETKCTHNRRQFAISTGITTCMDCKEVIERLIKNPIAPPLGFNHDFHKQAVEAEKELDKVCKIQNCKHELSITENIYEKDSLRIFNVIKTCYCGERKWNLIDHRKERMIEIDIEIKKLNKEKTFLIRFLKSRRKK